jgi:hypothetical protein
MPISPDDDGSNHLLQRRFGGHPAVANRPSEYRLDVIAVDVPELVRSAGGWLFDRVRSGWHISVDIGGTESDIRPLQILGVTSDALRTVNPQEGGSLLALSARKMHADKHVRARFAVALKRGDDVILWGDPGQAERNYQLHDLRYKPSNAAQAFKTHAFIAAGISMESLESAEQFRARMR